MLASPSITLSFPEPDIALLTIDQPGRGANVLSRSVLDELSRYFDELGSRQDLAGMILYSGKQGVFVAGADLREFASSLELPTAEVVTVCRHGQQLFSRLATMPFVTIAAIGGVCLGGGAELATWCDRRVLSNHPKTEVGFPEVKLGLFPGWGGTVRLPRIVGLGNAVSMITGGESVDPQQLRAMGLASDIVAQDQLVQAAIRVVRMEQSSRAYLEDRRRWTGPIAISPQELGFLGATASAYIRGHTKGHYPAPDAALETLLGGAGLGSDAALQLEAKGMARLFGSPTNRALLNVFFLTDRNKKDTGTARSEKPTQKVESLAVIGAGIMGAGIAAAALKRELQVVLKDANHDAMTNAARNIIEEVSYDRRQKKATVERSLLYAPKLTATMSDTELAGCDLVIEAVVEQHEVKKLVFAQIEPLLKPEAILASNTSTLPISTLAQSLQRPDRFCGIHFFNPVRKMKLVEVIRGKQTSDETIAAAVAFAKRIDKSPIVIADGPGFLVNRLLCPYLNEALELIAQGNDIVAIDKAARSFGMPMGPLELYDMVGLDTAVFAGRTMWEAFPDRIMASPMLPALVKSGRLGQKNGVGFYSYKNKKGQAQPDAESQALIEQYRKEPRVLTREEIADRLILPMLLEATRALEDGIARDPRDIDLALILGIGFPPFRGGLLFWADTLGIDQIRKRLDPLIPLGKRFQPTAIIEELSKTGGKFYPADSSAAA